MQQDLKFLCFHTLRTFIHLSKVSSHFISFMKACWLFLPFLHPNQTTASLLSSISAVVSYSHHFLLFTPHFLVNYYVVITIQGSKDASINKGMKKNPSIFGTYILMGKTSNKQNNVINMELKIRSSFQLGVRIRISRRAFFFSSINMPGPHPGQNESKALGARSGKCVCLCVCVYTHMYILKVFVIHRGDWELLPHRLHLRKKKMIPEGQSEKLAGMESK